jgi:hypothetical protein
MVAIAAMTAYVMLLRTSKAQSATSNSHCGRNHSVFPSPLRALRGLEGEEAKTFENRP